MTLEELVARFAYMEANIERIMRDVGEQIGQDAELVARAKFGTYQPAIGPFPDWAPLAPSTIDDKLRLGFPVPSPLYRGAEEGAVLRDSVHHRVESEETGVVVHLFSTDQRMRYHELGTVDMPARPVLGPTAFERAPIYAEMVGEEVLIQIVPGYRRTVHGPAGAARRAIYTFSPSGG